VQHGGYRVSLMFGRRLAGCIERGTSGRAAAPAGAAG
jgi:hypothetical protein